jgi:hypothetical protein
MSQNQSKIDIIGRFCKIFCYFCFKSFCLLGIGIKEFLFFYVFRQKNN